MKAIIILLFVGLAQTSPNVIVFLTDDQTLNSFSQMSYLQSRPYGSWVTFENSFLSTPLCNVSRATFLTGRYGHTVGMSHNDAKGLDESQTLAVWLQSAGYKTALFGKYLNTYPWTVVAPPACYVPPGWDDFKGTGLPKYYGPYTMCENGTLVDYHAGESSYQVDVVSQHALNFINAQDGAQPFFLVLGYFGPHSPHTPPLRHKFDVTNDFIRPNASEIDVSDKPAWIRALTIPNSPTQGTQVKHETQVAYAVDDSVEAIVELLHTRGILENTVIIFTTDNGYSHASHRLIGKLYHYEEPLRAPLMIRYPGAIQHTESRFVANVDWNPTICAIAGATATLVPHGASLAPLLESNPPAQWRTSILEMKQSGNASRSIPNHYAIRTADWKYAELSTGEKELYGLVADPYEMDNRANDPAYAAIQADLAAQLQALKGQQ